MHTLVALFTSLSFNQTLFTIAGAGVICHLVFKRTETHQPVHLAILLLIIPTLFSVLLVRHLNSVPLAFCTGISTYISSLLTSIILYRVSPWHPLARYPGPILCKITKAQTAFISTTGKQHETYRKLHEQYGDVVRVGPNELSIRDASAIDGLMGAFGLPKGPFWDGRTPESEPIKSLIALRDTTEHTRRRRPWTRALNTTSLKGYEEIIVNRTAQLVDRLANQTGTVVDLAEWFSFYTYDFMNDLVFGGGSEMMRAGADPAGQLHLLSCAAKRSAFMGHLPWLGQLLFRLPRMAKDLKLFRANAEKRALRRKADGSQYKDLYHHLLNEGGVAATEPSLAEIVSDGSLAIVAGSDTTSSALSSFFFFMLSNPTAYKRLQTEIDELGAEAMSFARQAKMPYLNASINETLRLLPPLLSGSTRMGLVGKVVGPYYLPPSTSAIIPIYTLHRDPRSFSPLPDAFIPERFLSAEQQQELEPGIFKHPSEVIHNTAAFIPFSTGPSNCVGKGLAQMQMKMVICALMQKFDLWLEEGYDAEQWEKDLEDHLVTVKGRLPVVLAVRN